MTKKFLVLLLVFSNSLVNAQNIDLQTVNTSGRHSIANGIFIEYSVGGLVPVSLEAGPVLLTQDFLQPFAGTTLVIPQTPALLRNSEAGVDNAGSSFANGNIVLDFTLGEFTSISLTSSDNMVTQGILQPYPQQGTLPVTGLEFEAKRINTNYVLLKWSTVQEINNKGFYLERKKANEAGFSSLVFIPSKAVDGNSSTPLSYAYTDMNEYEGRTYYRLKQVDIDQQYTYSPMRVVEGLHEGVVVLKAWPVPAIDNLNVKIMGIDKAEQLQVVDMQGRILKHYAITNGQTIKISGLLPGTYLLRLNNETPVVEKVIIQ